jgi:hypothetical protein
MGVDLKIILKKRPCILIIAMALVKGYWLIIMQIQCIISQFPASIWQISAAIMVLTGISPML